MEEYMNTHIEKYLDLYLDREQTEYATLITGKWGSGKTYFINRYIENKNKEEGFKSKFIYISLFGLKNISAVNDAIFQELHPILSHKGVKFITGVLGSALKLGFKIDLVGEKEEETTISLSADRIKLFNREEFNNIVFIFDDLERSGIDLPEILGFINSLCEKQNLKVIIIANEEELSTDDPIYKRFKEKVIGKSLKLINENDKFWEEFNQINSIRLELDNNKIEIIKSTFQKFGDNNYRILRQTTEDFYELKMNINPEFIKNNKFYDLFIEVYYTIALQYRKENDIDSVLTSLKNDYSSIYYQFFFGDDVWESIITNHFYDYEKLNNLISALGMFQIKEHSSWRALWNYRELSEEDFNKNLIDTVRKFKEKKYTHIGVVLHVANLIRFFIKNDLCQIISIDEIYENLMGYIDINKENDSWITHNIKFNGTGLGYIDEKDEGFINIRKYIETELNKNHTIKKNKEKAIFFYSILEDMKISISEVPHNNDYEKYRFISFLNETNPKEAIEKLYPNTSYLYNLCYYLNDRYATNHTINGIPLVEHLNDEKIFIDGLINALSEKLPSETPYNFERFKLNEILGMLKSIQSRFKN